MNYLQFLTEEIHTVVAATVDRAGKPMTCAIDIMDHDEYGLYFLTARGKSFYQRLIDCPVLALTGLKGSDTLHSVSLSLRGKVTEIGSDRLPALFEKNPYMAAIYPTPESRRALTVFLIHDGSGEWFDLSRKPIERQSFTFGSSIETNSRYMITENCIGCETCLSVCPQQCIDVSDIPAVIHPDHCLHCGNCQSACPVGAVVLY